MNKLLNHIKSQKLPVYFISPHFDDAIFSAGALMIELSNLGVDIKVINIFTKASSPSTLSGLVFLKKCGYSTPENLYKDRVVEDKKVISKLKNAEVINLGFEDALWRKLDGHKLIPESNHVYPTHRLHIAKGKISTKDSDMIQKIKAKLTKIIPKNAIVFGPLAVGKHVDHVIVNKIISEIDRQKVFWVDYPYSQYSDLAEIYLPSYSFSKNKSIKKELIAGYKTQVSAIFQNKIDLVDEVFYSSISRINPKVSISIPAHNEENSIDQLLTTLSGQASNVFDIAEIIVYCDGCTDKTVEIVSKKASKDKRIKMIISNRRTGLSVGQNTLLKASVGDVVVLLNSDIKIDDKFFIEKISQKIISGSDIVSVKLTPLPPKTFFEKVLYKSTLFKEKTFEENNRGNNMLTCHGPARAFSKRMAKKITFKFDTGEDAYSYLYAVKNNLKYSFVANTEVMYRLPDNYSDYLNQSKRFSKSASLNNNEFGKDFFQKHSKIHLRDFVRTMFSHPFFTLENIFYLFVYAISLLFTKISIHNTPENKWKPAISTKKL